MKTSVWIAAGVALAATAVYFLRTKKKPVKKALPVKENERHHLTNLFSKAKRVALNN